MSLEPGQRLAHYLIDRKIGEGGMGEVYRARDERLGRAVAVKVLPEEIANDSDRLRRFEQEAYAASALNHPGILTVHDFAREGEVAYLVTELLEGESLRARLRRGPLPVTEAVAHAAAIASALCAAHARGIVHRDLKPENLFLTTDGRIKILDFGLSLRVTPPSPGPNVSGEETMERLTRTGAVLGTAGYMAPEQARGLQVDQRADLFSLGCVVLEMITGRSPFQRDSIADTLSAILNDDPLSGAAAPRGLGAEVERVLRHCLEKEPARRFQSAGDVAFALESLAVSPLGGPSDTRSLPSIPGAGRWLMTSLAAIGLIAVIAVAWFARGRRLPAGTTPAEVRSIAVLPFTAVRSDANLDYLGEGIAESLISRLSPLKDLEVLARTTVFRFKSGDDDPLEIGRQLGVTAVVAGRVEEVSGRLLIGAELVDVASGVQIWGERFDRPFADLFEIEEDVARRIGENLAIRLGRAEEARLGTRPTASEEAYRLYLKGRHLWYQRSSDSIRKSIDLFRTAVELDPEFALAWNGLGDAYTVGWAAYSGLPLDEAYRRGEAAVRRALALQENLSEVHTSLGFLLFERSWDWSGAEREFRLSLELDPGSAYTHQAYGEYLYCIGRFDESLRHLERALALDPLSEIVASVIGWSYLARGDAERALQQFRTVLQREPDFADALSGQALAVVGLRRPDAEQARSLLKLAEVSGLSPTDMASLEEAHAGKGLHGLMNAIVEIQLRGGSYSWLLSPQFMAWTYGLTGQTAKAMAVVEQMFADRSPAMSYAKTGTFLDPLRSEPRLQEILAEMRFPESPGERRPASSPPHGR